MATNKRLLAERMESKTRYANAQKFAWAEMIVILLMFACAVVFIVVFNALVPKGW